MSGPIHVTDADFDEKVLKSDLPILVDFWAEWCGPCKMIAPIVEELSDEYAGQFDFAKLDVDTNPTTAMAYSVRSIPTLLIFKGGKVVDQIIGAVPKVALKNKLDSTLG